MISLRLAFADIRHDAVHFLCAVILIAAMIGPLLVLLGVKVGAVTVLLSDLRDSPDNLGIFIEGAHEFSAEDVERVRALPGVGFAEGQNIVTTTGRLALQKLPDGNRSISGGYGTTGAGDPLTELGGTLAGDELLLSEAFARRLRVEAGDRVAILLERGPPHTGAIEPEFKVLKVLPDETITGNYVLLSADTVAWIEAYGFGYAVPAWSVSEGLPLSERQDSFEKIRIYAVDLSVLPDLARRLEEILGVQTSSRAREVLAILKLESNLNAALSFVAGAGVIGLFFVLMAHFWSAVRRKRLSWSMLSLMGMAPIALAAVPVTQAALVSLAGFAGGLLVYLVVERTIGAWFGAVLGGVERVAILPVDQAVLVGVGVVAISVSSSAAAGYAIMRTDPAAIIRSS
ncbi:hypothetical protein [Pelagibius sp. Alg239-R121]|uniref:hypothetical protein n=1 Tax=Pelagibius sp. Alg239-R121 TaxID=2993448 RepID=UPI0024A69231|nr:hypothetical protein [Pelagibius sp. Alg239-R121]